MDRAELIRRWQALEVDNWIEFWWRDRRVFRIGLLGLLIILGTETAVLIVIGAKLIADIVTSG